MRISVVLLSHVLGLLLTCVRSHPPSAEVTVTSQFSDGRHVTFACLSYKPFGPHQLLALNSPIQPSVTWTNQQFDADTAVQKCHMLWREATAAAGSVRSSFEAFTGSHDHDDATDAYTQEVKYRWVLNEYGLSRYSFKLNDFSIVKPLAFLHYVGVNVVSFLSNGETISTVCISKEPSGRKEVIALGSSASGDGVGWSNKDFSKETSQVCRVEFGDHRRHGFVFEAFAGSWKHEEDVSILDAIDKRRRMYYWVLRDTGLYRYNYHTNAEDFFQSFP